MCGRRCLKHVPNVWVAARTVESDFFDEDPLAVSSNVADFSCCWHTVSAQIERRHCIKGLFILVCRIFSVDRRRKLERYSVCVL